MSIKLFSVDRSLFDFPLVCVNGTVKLTSTNKNEVREFVYSFHQAHVTVAIQSMLWNCYHAPRWRRLSLRTVFENNSWLLVCSAVSVPGNIRVRINCPIESDISTLTTYNDLRFRYSSKPYLKRLLNDDLRLLLKRNHHHSIKKLFVSGCLGIQFQLQYILLITPTRYIGICTLQRF